MYYLTGNSIAVILNESRNSRKKDAYCEKSLLRRPKTNEETPKIFIMQENEAIKNAQETEDNVPASSETEQNSEKLQPQSKKEKKNFWNFLKGLFVKLGLKIKDYFTYNIPGKRPRIWELDLLRGIILIVVTFDHCCLFSYYWHVTPYVTEFGQKLLDFAYWYCECDFRKGIQPFGLFFLSFLSGINCSFTRSGLRRVIKFLIYCALFMGGYAILHFIIPDLVTGTLIFNIITILTIAFVLWYLMDLIKCPEWVRATLGAIMITVGLVFYYKHFVKDGGCYVNNDFLALLVYNKHGWELSPNNFEPLFPHLGFFLVGGVLSKHLFPNKKTMTKTEIPPKALYPVLIVGKHSLSVFIFGPVVILGIVRIIIEIIHLFM